MLVTITYAGILIFTGIVQDTIPPMDDDARTRRKDACMKKETQNKKPQEGRRTQARNKVAKKNTSSLPVKWIVCAVFVVVVLAYGFGVYHYKDHFYRDTYVNGISLGGMTLDEAERAFTDDLESHKIALEEKERTEIIDPADIDTVISVGTQIADLFHAQSPWSWVAHFFGQDEQTITLDVSFDEEKLADVVDGLECFNPDNVVAPEDAYIKAGETQFEIVPEVLGNTVKKKSLLEAIENGLATGVTVINLEESDLYKLPKYYEKDEAVQNALAAANKYASSNITYDFSYTTETVDYNLIKDWVDISKDFEVTLDDSKVGDYVEELGSKYNTMGASRDFTTSYGEKINAYGGNYGWKIYFDKEKEKLLKNLENGKTVTREPEYSYTAVCRNSARDDIGDSYVEISISNQEVWLYVDGECILNTSCVTGTSGVYDTDTGVYALTYKESPSVLTGSNANGSGYSSEVTYWMPFNGNQGMHDATWRSSFGGSIYRGSGSHGCVNLPYSAAATIYKHVEKGFPIVIY